MNLVVVLTVIIKEYTAGDPMDDTVRWTNLSWFHISELLKKRGLDVGRYVVKNLMKQMGYVRRKMVKCKTMVQVKDRNEQFENIRDLVREFISSGLPVLSIDTKKKEQLGNLYREGRLLTQQAIEVFDHDFQSFSDGTIVPHGIYDLYQNKCDLTLGQSKDTAEFMCDNIRYFWENHIKYYYPAAGKMLLLCDGGGSNGCRHHVVKEALSGLAKGLQLEIVVAHYPAYCSKWNPIEHKAFCHITRAWQGEVFSSLQKVADMAQRSTTKTGFAVEVWKNKNQYTSGIKASDEFMKEYPVKYSGVLPLWNYSLNAS